MTYLLVGLLWLLHWLPLPILGGMGDIIGAALFPLLRRRRQIALTNLRLCFPKMEEIERIAIARRHFQAYARSILERSVLWWGGAARLRRLIKVETDLPIKTLDRQLVILLCPHFVGLDVAGVAIAMEIPACSIYSRQSNQVIDSLLRKRRCRFHDQQIFVRDEGILPVIRAMKKGRPFFMLPDMDFGVKDAEFVPFFGVPAATITALPRLAAATRARVIPIIATSLPYYRGWRVKIYPAWENYPEADFLEATRQMNAFIEARILEVPEEYFWTHKRFKTRPLGQAGFY